MALKIFNWLTRTKETFTPLYKGHAGLYVCGPTVHGHAHIGHAKAYLTYDILHRYLEHIGYKVRYVRNITDVGELTEETESGEDKIARKSRLEQLEPMEIVEIYTRSFFNDMDTLNILPADISPRASAHIPEQLELARILIEKGHAYESNGSVFFHVTGWPDYGKLSGKKIDQLEHGVRIKTDSAKKDPRDFAVWRAVKPGYNMRWSSPWGKGFPGWHAECTVMAAKYLGLPFDIHGGGLENIFPHNESEIAQCEAAYNTEFARFWVLNNMVTVNGTKMGKSLGNYTTIQDALKQYSPMTIRFFILNCHYRSTTDFSIRALDAAARGYGKLQAAFSRIKELQPKAEVRGAEENPDIAELIDHTTHRFYTAMNDDLNTPAALAALFDYSRQVNKLMDEGAVRNPVEIQAMAGMYHTLGGSILGLFADRDDAKTGSPHLSSELIKLLIELRHEARIVKDWKKSDHIRDRLTQLGITLEDRGDGTTDWKQEVRFL